MITFFCIFLYLALPLVIYTTAAIADYVEGTQLFDMNNGVNHAKILLWPLYVVIWLLVRIYKLLYWLIYGGYKLIADGVVQMLKDQYNEAKNYKPYEE